MISLLKPSLNKTDAPRPCGEHDCRCDCGQLLARLTNRGVEIKCRRCREVRVLPLSQAKVHES